MFTLQKPDSWRDAMRRRLRRIWEDIRNKYPECLKCCKKRKAKSTVNIITTEEELKDTKGLKRNVQSCVDNKGYNQEPTVVHPFQVTEK